MDKATLDRVQHEFSRVIRLLNDQPVVRPTCGNCEYWLKAQHHSKPHGVCDSPLAQAKTFKILETLPEFGCIYFEEKQDGD